VIAAVVVVPGAPALVPALMGAAAADLDPVREAARAALREVLLGFGTPPWVVVAGPPDAGPGGGASPGDVPLDEEASRPGRWAGRVSAADFGRAVELDPLPGARDGVADPAVPTALLAARWLLGDIARESPGAARWSHLTWLAVTGGAAPTVSVEGPGLLVVAADGAASHGPRSPRAAHPGAAAYDDALTSALGSGDPARLGAVDVGLGRRVGALGPEIWPWLGRLTAGRRWAARVVWWGHPFGIGYHVARWEAPAGPAS
jgi:hypothetical protein